MRPVTKDQFFTNLRSYDHLQNSIIFTDPRTCDPLQNSMIFTDLLTCDPLQNTKLVFEFAYYFSVHSFTV